MFRKILFASVLALGSNVALAACYGSGAYYSCTDDSGNSYSVSKYGKSTSVTGSNASKGTTWNQNSTTIGGTTIQNGTSSDGGAWNQTIQSGGGITTYSGTDSNGDAFSKTCTSAGCF